MTIETRFYNWLDKVLAPSPIKPRENTLIDLLALRYQRVLRLREIARKEAAEAIKAGQPYSAYKLSQADRVLRMVTDKLNDRPISHNLNLELND